MRPLVWEMSKSTSAQATATVRPVDTPPPALGERRLRAIFDTVADAIVIADQRGQVQSFNPAAERMFGYEAAEIVGRNVHVLLPVDRRQRYDQYVAQLVSLDFPSESGVDREGVALRKDGSTLTVSVAVSQFWEDDQLLFLAAVRDISSRKQVEQRIEERTRQLSQANMELSREVAERLRAELELESVHRQLVEAARRAGMAEIATDVLHNVGNVLNSVNVGAALVRDRLRHSQISQLNKVVDLLAEHADNLPGFFSRGKRGEQLVHFLSLVAEHLGEDRHIMLEEMTALTRHVDHVKTIVAMQQSYAGGGDMTEVVRPVYLLEDALRLHALSLSDQNIEVVREIAPLEQVRLNKQKLLQVLVNLIANARDAIVEADPPQRRLIVRLAAPRPDWLRIEVVDNGIGVAEENLTRIFSHGFTTKKHGHGFGLHSSANAVQEMGGTLEVHSDGIGRGTSFALELPCLKVERGTPPG